MNKGCVLCMVGVAGMAVIIGRIHVAAEPGGVGANLGGCTPGIGPDVVVGNIAVLSKWGTVGEISGYSMFTESCNLGDENLLWQALTPNHPVIGQNLYRLHNGRFEQLGMSWLKHGFSALALNLCCTCQDPGSTGLLGVGCSDPYSAGLNGRQEGMSCGGIVCGGLGPRSEVNASTGSFLFPYGDAGLAGDFIYKRLQVHNDDLDPELNPGALYYGEGHYVTPDDAAAGNHHNNASYRRANVGLFSAGGWNISFVGTTTRELPAIYAWQDNDPAVVIEIVDDDSAGRFFLGYRATDNGDGTWHYEYALHNLNSHRSAGAFGIPIPACVTVTNIGFHDVDYHSGEPYLPTDWVASVDGGMVSWSTDAFDPKNDVANALRWGTLYNFRFDADMPPMSATATIGLYRPGTPTDLSVSTLGPAAPPCPWDIDGDGFTVVPDLLSVLGSWGTNPGGPPDFDCDGVVAVPDLLALLANWGACPGQGPCGDPSAGNCFAANGTPGCSSLECCETICVADPSCCDKAWDAGCKDMANQLCADCGSPAAGDCCQPNGSPGCDDLVCCGLVCESDPFCCQFEWDELCADEAQAVCSCP